MEVLRSWRVGADCKSVAELLNWFESNYFHRKLIRNVIWLAYKTLTLVVQVRVLTNQQKICVSSVMENTMASKTIIIGSNPV